MSPEHRYREYRNGADRRKRKIPALKYLLFGGRRQRIRRKKDEGRLIIQDAHGSGIFALAVIILVLSAVDGLLALNLIGSAAREVNPVMSYFIEINPYLYFFAKCFFTIIGVVFIVILRNYKSRLLRWRLFRLLPVIMIVFMLIVLYELYLKFQLVIRA